MFFLVSIALIAYMTYVTVREGSEVALRKSFLLTALLLPTWLTFYARSIRLDFRIVLAFAAIGLLML